MKSDKVQARVKQDESGRTSYDLPQRFDYELDAWIDRARDGDPVAAQAVLARYVSAVDERANIDQRILEFLATAFRDMLAAGTRDPRRALGLLRKTAGNPRLTTLKRPLTQDDREERQQLAFELIAKGLSDAEVIEKLCDEPIQPARLLGRDTARHMVRRATQDLPRRRDELRVMGMVDYEITRWLAMEFGVPEIVVERTLTRINMRRALRH